MNETITVKELHNFLVDSEVNFVFEKKDGEKREARGTLNSGLIPKKMLPIGDHVNKTATNPKYYDLDKSGWRSLSYDCSTVELLSTVKY